MSRVLKDLVVACVLTLVGLAVGLWLAGADAHADTAGRQPDETCLGRIAASGNGRPPGCGIARVDAPGTKVVRFVDLSRERSVARRGRPASE